MVEDYIFDNVDRLDILRHYASDGNNAVLSDNVLKDEFDYGYTNDNQRNTLQEKFLLNGVMKTDACYSCQHLPESLGITQVD